ncbi:cell division protein FtsW [Xylanimonas cellulosilytica DSM 15894]|uniref:Probable peptidoglycan glycosyltransferase FtsW n=1 Tax=Xylanimonas cellulosilytica (strain DSM 15894 / JCM 12276 / CECT 5975 / KCTC 9989 / LMG 20990 / NBRC 107835 / XIL07) TaxID=446471 RepID=D1C0C5_XYLCX|nr:putative lipid II flippase FtsW [Xylanimonas cellulosilytica]ACZ30314.1 cell division protein FtsW [Xylanimonas cellulosilytica DSM 15894]
MTAATTTDERQWLGQWNSSVTSYYALTGATGLLLAIGLVMVLSSSTITSIAGGDSPYAEFLRQGQFFLLGLPVMVAAALLPVRWYKRLAWPALLAAVALQGLTLVPAFARSQGGNTGWIAVGGFTMQPAEVGKLALALWLGFVLGRKQRMLGKWSHTLLPAAPGAVLVIGLVLAGHDLGTAMVVCGLVLGAFWVAGAPARLLGLGGGLAAAIVGYVFVVAQDGGNRMSRILATFDPACDTATICYQSQHGMYALGTGGLFGVGLGASREKWKYLPEAHNDFIYAVIGEELGLFGTLMVLALFVVLGIAMARVVRRHPDPFVKVTTAAVACWVVGQAFVNIGVVIGVFPVIGVPLPLVSAGGSALVTTMAALGMILAFARSEPGAAEALAARGGVVRRSLAVLGVRRGRGRR